MEYLTIPVVLSKQGLRDNVPYRNTANVTAFVVGDATKLYGPGQLVYVGFVGDHRADLWHGHYRFVLASAKLQDAARTEFSNLLGFSAEATRKQGSRRTSRPHAKKEAGNGCDA